jgi:hypothetical protein
MFGQPALRCTRFPNQQKGNITGFLKKEFLHAFIRILKKNASMIVCSKTQAGLLKQ